VQTVSYSDLLRDELVTGIDQQLQVRVQVRRVHAGQAWLLDRHPGNDQRVTFVVLAATPAAASSLRGQVRRDVEHLLTRIEQDQGQRTTEPLGPLDRDVPRTWHALDPGPHPGEFAPVSSDSKCVDHSTMSVDRSSDMDLGVGVDPDGDDFLHEQAP
jgi:hypothetical protein